MASTKTANNETSARRGRPRSGEGVQRRRAVLDAALGELVDQGYERLTMTGIAARAGASKETLYRWFENKEGLFAALIETNADDSALRVAQALDAGLDPADTLTNYATGLLTLLTGEESVALNRAAMSSVPLASLLLQSGRHRVGPLVEAYLRALAADGYLVIDDPAEAFRLLYGLTVQDTQIRVLLGERPPSRAAIRHQAEHAVATFLTLTRPPA